MRIFECDGITVIMEKKKVKRLNLTIKSDGIFLSVPTYVSYNEAEEFLKSRLEWIKKHRENMTQKKEIKYLSGDRISLLGKEYILNVFYSKRKKSGEIIGENIFIYAKNPDNFSERKKAFTDFCGDVLSNTVPEIFERYETLLGVKSSGVKFRAMKSRWGSCNVSTKEIHLNSFLAVHPYKCLEYVIMHELAHLIEPSHNERFKAVMSAFMPDWGERRKVLNE